MFKIDNMKLLFSLSFKELENQMFNLPHMQYFVYWKFIILNAIDYIFPISSENALINNCYKLKLFQIQNRKDSKT